MKTHSNHHTGRAVIQPSSFMPDDPLDEKCEAPALLIKLMEEECRRLSFLAVSQAQKIEGDGSARQRPTSRPPSRIEDLAGGARETFDACETNRQRLRAIKDAQQLWEEVKYAPASQYRRGSLPWKRAVAADGLMEDGRYESTSRQVCGKYNLSDTYVRKLRRALREGELEPEGEPYGKDAA